MVTRVGLYTLCYQDSRAAEENSNTLALTILSALHCAHFPHSLLHKFILLIPRLPIPAYQLYFVHSSTLFYSHLGWHYALLHISGISFCKPQLHRRICMCICTLYELEQKRVQDAVVGPGCKFLMAGMPIWHIWLK